MLSAGWYVLATIQKEGGFQYWANPESPAEEQIPQYNTLPEAIEAFKEVLEQFQPGERAGELIILRETRAIVIREHYPEKKVAP